MTIKEPTPGQRGTSDDTKHGFHWLWLVMAGALLIILAGVLLPRNAPPEANPKDIVTSKLIQFARNRREVLHNMARHFKVGVPAESDAFFNALESGRWEESKSLFESLKKLSFSSARSEGMATLWPVIPETFWVADAAHTWPAQKLLDYGQAVLGSLRPGMVYVGGNDAGLFIPTLLNETSTGEHHIILSQNSLTDTNCLQYIRFLYADRISTLSPEDSERVHQEYLADAQKRLQHDRQIPNEPKQILPGEDVRATDAGVQVSGHIAICMMREKLFQLLMEKNPDVSFAIAQSFPFKSTYSNATPLGPIMELRVHVEQHQLTSERATQSVDYWRAIAQKLLADPEAANSSDVRRAYAKLAAEQGALFLDRKFPAEAEQVFRIANEILPANPETVFRYVALLMNEDRVQDAASLAANAAQLDPTNTLFRDLVKSLQNAIPAQQKAKKK